MPAKHYTVSLPRGELKLIEIRVDLYDSLE